MSSQNVVTHSASASRLIGRVKWFNNKAGYGFITVTDGLRSGTDVFVHHSAVSVENQQYKYLVQGEYVEFTEVATSSGPHQYQASDVLGVKGGKLMCETRRDFKISRSNYKTTKNGSESQDGSLEQLEVRKTYTPKRNTTSSANESSDDKKEWTLIRRTTEKVNTRASRKYERLPKASSNTIVSNQI